MSFVNYTVGTSLCAHADPRKAENRDWGTLILDLAGAGRKVLVPDGGNWPAAAPPRAISCAVPLLSGAALLAALITLTGASPILPGKSVPGSTGAVGDEESTASRRASPPWTASSVQGVLTGIYRAECGRQSSGYSAPSNAPHLTPPGLVCNYSLG